MPGILLTLSSPAQTFVSSADEARLVGVVGGLLVLLILCVPARTISRRFGLPDAVTLVFARVGAPKRLHVLVEGESLFNDATAIAACRNLCHSLDLQIEGVRHEGKIPEFTLHPPSGERFETMLYRVLERVPGLRDRVERLRALRAARDYEVAWARYRGDERAPADLSRLKETLGAHPEVMEELGAFYGYWYEQARSRLDQTAELVAEFVATAQRRLADRLPLQAGEDEIRERVLAGTIPEGGAKGMLSKMRAELATLRASKPAKLVVGPEELLKKVPFFQELSLEEFRAVSERLRLRTASTGDRIVTQGRPGAALYLIARGVVRVTREDEGTLHDVATLMAGDFFGEMALLHGGARTATCRAVTPSALYELRREDLEVVCEVCPEMKQALEQADRVRRDELAALGTAVSDPV